MNTRRLARRVLSIGCLTVTASLLICGGCLVRIWHRADPWQQITHGPDTTVITGPLTPEGYIDYEAAVNRQASDGVTPENNAVVLLAQALGPPNLPSDRARRYYELLGIPERPADGNRLIHGLPFVRERFADPHEAPQRIVEFEEQVEAAEQRPWSRDEFPLLGELLERNEQPLKLVIEASMRPRYFDPLISDPHEPGLYNCLPVTSEWSAISLLRLRAMSRLEAGDIAEAWEDLLACHRLVRLVGQAPEYIPKLRSFGLEAQVIDSDQALLTSPALTTTQARQCLSDLDQLPPLASIVEAVDNVSRLEFADCVQWLARGRTGVLADLADEPAQDGNTGQDGRTMLNAVIDWNVVLRMGNKHYDAVVHAMRIPDYATRSAELKRLSTSKRPPDLPFAVTLEGRLIEKALTGGRENATRAAGEVLLVYLALSFDQAQAAQDRAHARERLARIGFALAAYRRARGEYPEEQDLLVPGYLSESLLDSFTDLPFHYRRTDTDGFLLYSVGDNMQDDGGATSDSRPRADDLAIAVPIVPR